MDWSYPNGRNIRIRRSGETCYVEPSEIVDPTKLRQLFEMTINHRVEVERNVASLGQLDVVIAMSNLRNDGTVSEEGVVR